MSLVKLRNYILENELKKATKILGNFYFGEQMTLLLSANYCLHTLKMKFNFRLRLNQPPNQHVILELPLRAESFVLQIGTLVNSNSICNKFQEDFK